MSRWDSFKEVLTPRVLFAIFLAVGIGGLIGVALFTFGYAGGASYFSNDPTACANCHVMNTNLDAWRKSSHRSVAACNDCHVPHDLVGKYLTKAENGYHHSLAFTTGEFPTNIQIRASSLKIAEENCLRCHTQLVDDISHARKPGEEIRCTQCHANVGHMR